MMKDTLLVIGIHRDELGFGDRVAAHIDPSRFDLMRIPQGIPQAKTSPRERFYSSAQHREIYLQLHQQVHNRYRLLIDLHRGLDEAGRSADVFSHDERFLKCLAHKTKDRGFKENVRLVHIASTDERVEPSGSVSVADAEAKTWIPHRVWLGTSPLYVGLEIYLAANSDGEEEDWEFARMLISEIQTCEPR